VTALFVWRNRIELHDSWDYQQGEGPFQVVQGLPAVYEGLLRSCPFCRSNYRTDIQRESGLPIQTRTSVCTLCGFDLRLTNFTVVPKDSWKQLNPVAVGNEDISVSGLKRLDLNSAELGLSEVGTHLKRKYDDVHHLLPRRFEELVADVYRHLGFDARLTKQTRDGGYDIVLLEHSSGRQIIVECKRYSPENTVGVGVVDRVLGVQLRKGIREAKIVTTSRFTLNAVTASQEVAYYSLDLVDGEDLLRNLDVYDAKLPPLSLVERLAAEDV
jgi:hypothetical protein